MAYGFLDTLATPSVQAAQAANGSRQAWAAFDGDRAFDRFSEDEAAFIAQRDSFYIASMSKTGWPYIQHRGGPPGFLKVLDETTLGFADFRGNRQYISLGNIADDDRVALFLMDYPNRARLKILAHTEIRDLNDDPALAEALAVPGYKAKVERAILFRLEAFDWNCPQHITPRYTKEELQPMFDGLESQLRQLQAENKRLRSQSKAAPGS